jgi:hypothetical protein
MNVLEYHAIPYLSPDIFLGPKLGLTLLQYLCAGRSTMHVL